MMNKDNTLVDGAMTNSGLLSKDGAVWPVETGEFIPRETRLPPRYTKIIIDKEPIKFSADTHCPVVGCFGRIKLECVLEPGVFEEKIWTGLKCNNVDCSESFTMSMIPEN